MRVSWASEITDTMCDFKRKGYDFDTAWSMAIRKHPVRGQQWNDIETENLFEAAQTGDGSYTFMHRALSDAWHGRRPALRHLRILLDSEGLKV